MDALSDIIEWAKVLPKWQQLIINNILDGSELNSAKVDEMLDAALGISKIEDNLLDEFKHSEETGSTVCLASISELNNINNLKDNEKLSFNVGGLSVVYGPNGSGKSGYSRIIKKCCRSRDKNAAILGNVHNLGNKNQSAKINYQLDNAGKEYVWDNDADILAELQAVHVFDRTSGDIFLSKEADIQYKPSGMDILDKLVLVLHDVEKKLQERSERLQIVDLSSYFWDEFGETKATSLVKNLSEPNAREQYESLSQLSKNEQIEMEDLSDSIQIREKSSPAEERERLSKRNDSLQKVYNYYIALKNCLSEERITSLNAKVSNLVSAKKNADDAKNLSFDSDQFLAGTGNELWKTMWHAAEKFSKEFAYVGQEYPSANKDTKCVLCQQTLDSGHIDIMTQFGKYVNDESQGILLQSQSEVTAEINTIKSLIKRPEDEEVLLKSIEVDYLVTYTDLTKQLPIIKSYLDRIVSALQDVSIIQEDSQILKSSKKNEDSIRKILDTNEAELKKSLDDEDFKTELDIDKTKLNELKARQALKRHEESILKNIELLPKLKQIEIIKKQCNTIAISKKISELSKKYIIDDLSQCFNNELQTITNNKIEAELIFARSKDGIPYSKIVLKLKDGESHYDKIEDVLSEGELRGVALAGFFAELNMASNTSTVVLDDPVSSLDHINAERIAKRIVRETENRQVIIFTHDILFVSYILSHANDKKSISLKTIDSLDKAGLVTDGLPFEQMTVKRRVKALRNTLESKIKPAYSNSQITEYKKLVGQFYNDLRLTWERAVEEILFGDVVKRYSRNISTQQLKDVKYTPENARIVNENMTICSSKKMHDPATGEEIDFGTPIDIEQDLDVLEKFRTDNPK